jgi:ABC-2 type transport system permease protein
MALMNWHCVGALVLRYTYLHRRSVPRMFELFFWPTMDLLVWGYLTKYLTHVGGQTAGAGVFVWLIGAMIFWDILYRSQQGVSLSFVEDVWTRNLLNVFVAPVRLREFLAATFIVGTIKIAFIVTVLAVLSYGLYEFKLFEMGMTLIPLFANLLLMGWAVGMVTTSLILRWGQAAEALAWGVPFLIQPLAAVFYPVNVLPSFIQPVSWCIPATHVFEGMRAVMAGEGLSTEHLAWAFALNAVYIALAALFFRFMFARAREKGLLVKLATQ